MTVKPQMLLTLLILSATLALAVWSDHRNPEILARPLDSVSSELGGWVSTRNEKLSEGIVATLDATSYLSRTYRKGPDELDMFTAFYARQKAGESMHSPKQCLPGDGWQFEGLRTVTVATSQGPVAINRSEIKKSGSRALLLYWYQSRKRVVTSEYQGKIFLVWDALFHADPAGSIVRVILPDRPDAEREGLEFAAQLLSEVQKCFRAN